MLLNSGLRVLYESPDPSAVYAYTPGLCRLSSGRLVATMDHGGPGVKNLPGPKGFRGEGKHAWQGRIWTSDDRGETWDERGFFPFMHARPFAAGKHLYILGHDADLCIIRSDDEGVSWSEPSFLTEGDHWHQSACNVHYARDRVYLVMEKRVSFDYAGWPVSELAPILMSARGSDDLSQRESWVFASELNFADYGQKPELIPVPFWPLGPTDRAGKRVMHPPGWLETNVVQFGDPDHIWHDPQQRTFHLWMRAHTGGTQLACVARVVEGADLSLETQPVEAPSGARVLYVPCPGGQMRFHILYDELSRLYWLLSSVATESMIHPDRMGSDRYNLPNNERHILGLHFSKNCMDWCFAGVVARGDTPLQARHYATMVIDNGDLLVLSRSGDHRAKSAHDGNLITLHRVRDFRGLVYI